MTSGLSRLESMLPVSDFALIGSSPLLRAVLQTELLLPPLQFASLEPPALAFDSSGFESLLLLKALSRLGALLSVCGLVCLGFLLPVPDFLSLESLLLLQSMDKVAVLLLAVGMSRTDLSMFIMDFVLLDVLLFLHSYLQTGILPSVSGASSTGPSLLALDSSHMDLPPLLRASA